MAFPKPQSDPDDVSILVDGDPSAGLSGVAAAVAAVTGSDSGSGKSFKWWSEFELSMGLDSYSAAGFSAPFDPDRREFRDAFRPFSYRTVQVKIGGELMFTGRMMDIEPDVDAKSQSVQVTAYALPDWLSDNTPPSDLLPLEFNKLDIGQIAKRLTEPFGFGVEFATPLGTSFDKAKCEKDQSIQDFLVELAKQRGLVLSDTPAGDLLFRRSAVTGSPVARLKGQPIVRIVPTFDPRSYYSELTGFASKKSGKSGSKWTEKNPRYLGTNLRTLNFLLDDTDSADVPHAVRAKLGRMHGNMVSYVIEDLPTWRDPAGNLWQPNTTVIVDDPGAMIYGPYEFLIRNVVLRESGNGSRTASLGLTLPGSFDGSVPDRLPWEEK